MEKIIEKAGVLLEALPYIKTFRHKVFVVKFGGSILMNDNIRLSILRDIVFLSFVGIRPVLVHGGGPAIDRRMKEHKLQPEFVEGLRVTDKKTIKIVIRALSELNRGMVKEIKDLGANASGLAGCDDNLLKVKKHQSESDVGYVGDVVSVNSAPINRLIRRGTIPVIAPIGIGKRGEPYNVNADEASAHIASSLRAEKLVLLTNVKGIARVPDDEETLISTLKFEEAEILINENVIQAGMIPKVRAAIIALKGDVKKAHIIDGSIDHSLLLEIFTDKGIGTEILK